MSIFTTSGSQFFIGPQVAGDQTLLQYEAMITGTQAQGSIAFSANPADTSTITIQGTAVQFAATPVTGKVTIGGTVAATLANLLAFLEASSDANLMLMTYSIDILDGLLIVQAILPGSAGNAYTLAASTSPASHGVVSAATLSNGGGNAWVLVGEVENLGQFGDASAKVTFAAIQDGRVRKMKGARDAGDIALVVGQDARDPGQLALSAAQQTKSLYAFKVIAADQRLSTDSPSLFFFNGLVASQKSNFGTTNNVVKTTYSIEIDSAIIEVPSAAA